MPRLPVRLARAPAHCTAAPARAFTTSSPARALGPESPNYVEVPKPLQPTFPPTPRIKGVLPTPRDVFKTRSPLPKQSDESLQQATRDPVKPKMPGPFSRDADRRLHKQRLAASRKQALRQGVQELHERKTATEASEKASLQQLFAERKARAMAPPRDVDVLTEATVSKSIRDFLADNLPSTSRTRISNKRRDAFQKKMQKHADARQARIHHLYHNAREFIVSEQQLDEAIEQAFGTEDQPVGWNNKGEAGVGEPNPNPWAGPIPDGVSDMMRTLKEGGGVTLAKERMKKVAEELTGGKF